MPQYAGLLLENGKFCGPIYKVTMQIAPDKFGISRDATNEEMLRGFLECVTSAAKDAAAAARAEGAAAGRAAERADVVAMLRNAADEVGGVWMADVADGIEAGEHVGAAGGAA